MFLPALFVGFLLIFSSTAVTIITMFFFSHWIVDCDVTLGLFSKFGKSISSLKGKVVFITGASSGIGEYLAVALAKHGVKLVLTARREQELERVKTKCIDKSKGQLMPSDILVICMDVLDVDMHQKHFSDAVAYFGQVDILVNNAGRSQRAIWENIDQRVDHQMFDLNVHAVISLTRVAVKYFKDKDAGHVAVTSSLAGVIGVPYSGTYTGTKYAIHGYYNSLRCEKTGSNLTVSIFCPGPTSTNFLSQSFTENPGQNFGTDVASTDKRMTGKRCGYLCAIALANKLNESWMSLFPLVPFAYIAVYFPNVYSLIVKILGPKKLFKLRDSKDVMEIRDII